MMDIEKLAREGHDAYERLAPQFGYETRIDTRKFDPTSPNGRLMMAVYAHIAALVAEEAAKVCEEMRANESVAAAHYAGNFQQAFDYHLQRHAIIADVRDAIRERFKAS